MNRKTFRTCLIASLILHGAVALLLLFRWEDTLFQWSGGRLDRRGVITVNLTLGEAVSEPLARPEPKTEPAPPTAPVSQKPNAVQLPKEAPPKPVPKKSAPKQSESSGSPAISSGRGDSPTPAGGEGEGYDASDTKVAPSEVLALIRQRILRAKRYPPMARRQGEEGSVEVRFKIAPNGGLESASIVESSGSDLLDAEALATLKRGAPYLYYAGEIRMSLKFDLGE